MLRTVDILLERNVGSKTIYFVNSISGPKQ